MERVRPLGAEEAPPGRRSPLFVALLAATAVGALGVLLLGGSGGRVEPPIGVDAAAAATVRSFEASLSDPTAPVDPMISQAWLAFDLPGLGVAASWRLTRAEVVEAILFYRQISDLSLGGCSTTAAIGASDATTIVTCPAARFGGPVMEALGIADSPIELSFSVGTDGVIALYAPSSASPLATDYCLWAEENLPALASGAFDDECVPDRASDAAAHLEMAGAFVDAGRPSFDPEVRGTRLAMTAVSAFEARLAGGDEPGGAFDRDWNTVRFPGLVPADLDPPFPSLSAFLDWSAVVYDVDLGDCAPTRFYAPATQLVVDCPDAVWSGPLMTVLGLGAVAQPISFLVAGPKITGVFGTSAPELLSAFDGLCSRLQGFPASKLGEVFDRGCVPVFTPEAGAQLIALANNPG